jgi:hypothetical protein
MTPIVFSDDLDWCAANLPDCVPAPKVNRAEEHLTLMSLCRRHIIANSTFSCWGAALAGVDEAVHPALVPAKLLVHRFTLVDSARLGMHRLYLLTGINP